MKKILVLLISLFVILKINAQQMIMTSPDVNFTSTGTIDETMRTAAGIVEGGRDITATGTLKIPIVFVKFADDNATTTHWPIANQLPTWAANFVDADIPTNNIYQNNNFSRFYDLSSGGNGSGTLGEFQVIGDLYFIKLNKNRNDYKGSGGGDAQVSKDVIDILDDPSGFNVDFTEYDNWEFKVGGVPYTHDNNPDGTLDFMLIYWKDKSISLGSDVGGVAGLGFSGTITKDGVDINSSNGVLGFKAQDFGNKHTIWISAHEIGHHQFGMINGNTGSHFNGRNDCYGQLQKFALMTTGDGSHFSAYERYRLGWLEPIIVTSNNPSVVLNETHKSSTNNAIIIPVGYTPTGNLEEYFLLENYHSTNAYSGANPFLTKSLFNHTISKGIIVYHISAEDFDWPTLSQVDIESAEGLFDWEVIQGASTPSDRLDDLIAKGSPNKDSGLDERGNITATAGTTTYTDYLALTPDVANTTEKEKKYRYDSNDYFGDQEDLFGLDYNNVFTKWSNPSSIEDDGTHSNVGFEIVSYNSSTHQYTINVAVNYSGIEALASSKPQNLTVAWYNDHPKLTWDTNGEPDMQSYKISKMIEGETGWATVATVAHNSSFSTHSWIDVNVEKPGKFDPEYTIHYKIRAYDNQSKLSVYSDEQKIEATTNYFWKKNENQDNEQVFAEYSLDYNYPNPFNPTTEIKYQIKEPGFVSLKVYDILGKEVAVLVNEHKNPGHYSITFDASSASGGLPSGVYIYKLQAGEFSSVKKMLLTK